MILVSPFFLSLVSANSEPKLPYDLDAINAIWGIKPDVPTPPAPSEFYPDFFKTLTIEELYLFKQSESFYRKFHYSDKVFHSDALDKKISHMHQVPIDGPDTWPSALSNLGAALTKLSKSMRNKGISALDPKELRQKANEIWQIRKSKESVGEVYLACSQEGAGSNVEPLCDPVKINSAAQLKIESYFLFNKTKEPNKLSNTLSNTDDHRFNKETLELRELNSLRIVTKIFEDNTYLKDDWGGWKGNFVKTMLGGTRLSRCGNETETYVQFVSALQDQGLLKSISLNDEYQDTLRGKGLDGKASHQAVLLVGLLTKKRFVLDSWLENGGEMAHILNQTDWANENDDADVVPGRN